MRQLSRRRKRREHELTERKSGDGRKFIRGAINRVPQSLEDLPAFFRQHFLFPSGLRNPFFFGFENSELAGERMKLPLAEFTRLRHGN